MFVNSLRAQSRCVASSSSRSPSLRTSTFVSSLASRKTTRPLRALSTDAASTNLQPSESAFERNDERSPLPVPRLLRETGELPHTEKTNKSASHTLYIGNLSPSVTEAELQAMFGAFGDAEIRMHVNESGQNCGYAHAEYPSQHEAEEAMSHHLQQPMELQGHTLKLDFAQPRASMDEVKEVILPNRSLYVGNLPYAATSRDIRQLFQHFGYIERVRIDYDDSGVSKGWAHVDFQKLSAARAVLKSQWNEKFQLHGRTLFLSYSRTISGERKQTTLLSTEEDVREVKDFRPTAPPSRTLWMGGLPSNVTERAIRDVFARFGECEEVRIIRRESNTFAHVDFHSRFIATKILQSHKLKPLKLWHGKDILLDYGANIVKKHFPPHHTLYTPAVSGDELDIRTLFGRHSLHIRNVYLHSRRQIDPSKRTAFIEFDTTAHAMAAREALDGTYVQPGVPLILLFAKKVPRYVRKNSPALPKNVVDSELNIAPKHDKRRTLLDVV